MPARMVYNAVTEFDESMFTEIANELFKSGRMKLFNEYLKRWKAKESGALVIAER